MSTCGLHTKEIPLRMKAYISVAYFRQNTTLNLTIGSFSHYYFVTETKNHLINYTLIHSYLCVFNCIVFNQLLRIYEEQRTKHQIGFTISCGFRSLASCFESSLPSLSVGNFWVDRLPTEPKHSV